MYLSTHWNCCTYSMHILADITLFTFFITRFVATGWVLSFEMDRSLDPITGFRDSGDIFPLELSPADSPWEERETELGVSLTLVLLLSAVSGFEISGDSAGLFERRQMMMLKRSVVKMVKSLMWNRAILLCCTGYTLLGNREPFRRLATTGERTRPLEAKIGTLWATEGSDFELLLVLLCSLSTLSFSKLWAGLWGSLTVVVVVVVVVVLGASSWGGNLCFASPRFLYFPS